MATYNGQKYLKEQVDSVLKQLVDEDELVVSDDGSTDATLQILNSYNDVRIKIFINQNVRGVVGNFENALSQAKGEYIFLCDQDDVWLPDKVSICVDALKQADLILHDAAIWNGDQIVNNSFFRLRGVKRGYFNNLIKNSYIGCCMAFSRKVLDIAMPFAKSIAMHDMYIGLLAERNVDIKFLNKPLILYRRHNNNTSQTGEKSQFSKWYQMQYRLQIFKATMLK